MAARRFVRRSEAACSTLEAPLEVYPTCRSNCCAGQISRECGQSGQQGQQDKCRGSSRGSPEETPKETPKETPASAPVYLTLPEESADNPGGTSPARDAGRPPPKTPAARVSMHRMRIGLIAAAVLLLLTFAVHRAVTSGLREGSVTQVEKNVLRAEQAFSEIGRLRASDAAMQAFERAKRPSVVAVFSKLDETARREAAYAECEALNAGLQKEGRKAA